MINKPELEKLKSNEPFTETITSDAAYINQVIRTYNFLTEQQDLSPRNKNLNSVLSGFVKSTMQPRSEDSIKLILSDPKVKNITKNLRQKLSETEFEMEHFCSSAMAGKNDVTDKNYASFPDFIYMDNYNALVNIELKALCGSKGLPPINPNEQSIAFIGAGPLPISPILLHISTGLPVTCIDSDQHACESEQNLLHHLASKHPQLSSLKEKMSYVQADGAKYDYVTHPIVFIASLVDHKDDVVFRILDTADTTSTIVIRSAEGLSTLLYEPYQIPKPQDIYIYPRKTQYCPEAINTSYVFSYPSGKPRARNKIDFSIQPDDVSTVALKKKRELWRSQTLTI
jgi:hypothetical protein